LNSGLPAGADELNETRRSHREAKKAARPADNRPSGKTNEYMNTVTSNHAERKHLVADATRYFSAPAHPSTARIFAQWGREGWRILKLAASTRRRAHFLAAARHGAGVVSQLGRFL
jgi:hypothetical protein